jgi:hypothetical protein
MKMIMENLFSPPIGLNINHQRNEMTNSEARQILIDYNAWRRGANEKFPVNPPNIGAAIDAAIVALGNYKKGSDYQSGYFDGQRSKSSIAQAIRDAAVNWPPRFLGDVECQIIDAFTGTYEHARWRPNSVMFAESVTQARTFMLLVAEALES